MGCLTSREDYDEDDRCSENSDTLSEAWVVLPNNDLPDIIDSVQRVSHDCEDWDAEVEANENPYDEEDVTDGCEPQPIGYQWRSEALYEPSSHHAPSIERSEGATSSTGHIEDGQFEDAE
ncbi:coordinator of PRMT5 and differentiation stimulator-like isoform X2 [Dendropsophus ebraccatus]